MDRGAVVSRGWNLILDDRRFWGVAALVLIGRVIVGLILPDAGPVWPIINRIALLIFTALLDGVLICMIATHLDQTPLTVTEGLKAGIHWLLPILAIVFLLEIPVWLVSAALEGAIAAPESARAMVVQSFWTDILRFIVNTPITLLCGAIVIGAERVLILEGRSIGHALLRGWRLLWTHLGDFWGIGIRLFFIELGIGFAFGCVLAIFSMIRSIGGSPGLGGVVSILVIAIASIFIVPFVTAVWNLAFREWQAQEHNELSVATGQN